MRAGAIAAAIVGMAAGARRAPAQGPPVRVTGGLVAGAAAPDGLREFRGIPFAAPPVGDLRWRPPAPVRPWRGVRDATRFAARCMQLPIYGDMVFRSPGVSEDCLYLNVWAPPAPAGARLPVLLYFYGGGFQAGDASELRYDGASLARRGIVVVTANYRLSVFGFLALPALTAESPHHASGDYGLLDQVAALSWVRDNIAAFGGDPGRITIGGESAGSISVSALMASPLSRGLIAGAIGESGALIRPTFAPVPLVDGEAVGERFAGAVGAASLAGLRALPAESLLAATARPTYWQFPITVDGYFLPDFVERIFARGDAARVPLLLGWNSQESSWRDLLDGAPPTPEAWSAVLRRRFGARAGDAERVFPGRTPDEVRESGTLLAGAQFTAFSTWKWAELARAGRSPVYRYLFTRPRPPMKAPWSPPPEPGAVHSAEIEYALGNLATNGVYAWSDADDSVSSVMERYFANFVKSGNPNGPGLPAWPALAPGDPARIMVIDAHSGAQAAPHEDAFRFLDTIYFPDTTR